MYLSRKTFYARFQNESYSPLLPVAVLICDFNKIFKFNNILMHIQYRYGKGSTGYDIKNIDDELTDDFYFPGLS